MHRFPICRARCESREEEVANAVSHAVGFLTAAIVAPVLIVHAARQGDRVFVAGVSIFVVSMLLLYLASTVYHALPTGLAKRVLRRIEHSAIFILIAGTYTPFTLGALRGAWGWSLLGAVWTLAVIGVLLTVLGRGRQRGFMTLLHLGMGWLVVVAVQPLWQAVGLSGLLWLLAGGIAYTLGVGFFMARQVRYAHFIWHLFVIAGTACHSLAVFAYAS